MFSGVLSDYQFSWVQNTIPNTANSLMLQVTGPDGTDDLVNFESIKIGSVTYNITDIAPLPHHPADLLVDFNDITGAGVTQLTDGYQGFDWQNTGSYFYPSPYLDVQQSYDGVNTNPYMSNGFAGQTSTITRHDGSDFSVNSLALPSHSTLLISVMAQLR